jgi:hypothetical protein
MCCKTGSSRRDCGAVARDSFGAPIEPLCTASSLMPRVAVPLSLGRSPNFWRASETLNRDAREQRAIGALQMGYWCASRAEESALCGPIEGQASIVHQSVGGELWSMLSVQDRRDDVGSEEGKP